MIIRDLKGSLPGVSLLFSRESLIAASFYSFSIFLSFFCLLFLLDASKTMHSEALALETVQNERFLYLCASVDCFNYIYILLGEGGILRARFSNKIKCTTVHRIVITKCNKKIY